MKHFIAAVRFITVLPMGGAGGYDPERMVPYFPIVGLMLGGLIAGMDRLLLKIWPTPVVSLLDVLFLVLLTGAFHLDGLGDTADGLLGHRPRERALAIMKDSRIGVMGLAAIFFGLTLKWAGIATLGAHRSLLLLIIPAYARGGMIFGIRSLPYGREQEGIGFGFFGTPPKIASFAGILIPVLLSIVLGWRAVWLNLWFAMIIIGLLSYYRRRMACITGDMLGAMTEVLESVMFLLMSVGEIP